MTVVRRAAFSPFSAEQMFELVNDVPAYPQFLPWCVAADVITRDANQMEARLTVQKGRFDYAFTTRNALEPHRRISLALVDGPFKRLTGEWRFDPVEDGCHVELDMEFEFKSRVLSAALTAAFKPLVDTLVDAFRKQAMQVYGG